MILVLAIVVLNIKDESPSPTAVALSQIPRSPYPPEQNLFFALHGINAPAEVSPTVRGVEIIQHYEKNLNTWLQNPCLPFNEENNEAKPHAIAFVGDLSKLPDPDKQPIGKEILAFRAQIERLVRENALLHQRYKRLADIPYFYEAAKPSLHDPYLVFGSGQLRAIQKLFVLDVAIRLQNTDPGEAAAALEDIQRDWRLWHTVYQGEGSLLTKMLALRSLQTDLRIIMDFLSYSAQDIPLDNPALIAILSEEKDEFWQMRNFSRFEFQFQKMTSNVIREQLQMGCLEELTNQEKSYWDNFFWHINFYFWKRQATENLVALQDQQMADLAATPASRFFEAQAQQRNEYAASAGLGYRMVYNPVGKTLASEALGSLEDYILRSHDAQALHRLVRLIFELRRQKISATQVPIFLEQHKDLSTHPVDGSAFQWDEKTFSIHMQPLAKQPGRRFSTARLYP